MATVKTPPTSPLRDRTVAHPQDTANIAMLQSGISWPTGTTSSPLTSPLKLAKRENHKQPFPQIPRRTSNSYKHLRNNNLVSKSPFKSQGATPSRPSVPTPVSPMRRVSAEKRPRPISMHMQAENEKPLQLKRDRKQSNVFQGLLQSEPVSKSPFKRQVPQNTVPPPTRKPPPTATPNRLPTPASSSSRNSPSPSPQRSSLVSKRLHGPRLSGSGKRERRKTVTWDERCDVIEIDRNSELSVDVFASDSEQEDASESMEVEMEDKEDPFYRREPPSEDADDDESYESDAELRLDADVSITGMVDSMLKSSGANRHTTPPPKPGGNFPPDTEMEDGVPLGRSHHKERLQEFHEQKTAQPPSESSPRPLPSPFRSSQTPTPSTPPLNISRSSISTPPLGRSTHAERVLAARRDQEMAEEQVEQLPGSPSPIKAKQASQSHENSALVPAFDISHESGNSSVEHSRRRSDVEDPFSLFDDDDVPPEADASFATMSDGSRRNSNASRPPTMDDGTNLDTSFSSFHSTDTILIHPTHDVTTSSQPFPHDSPRTRESSRPPSALDMFHKRTNSGTISNSPRGGSPLPAIPTHVAAPSPRSPLSRSGSTSPLLRSSTSSPNLRPHISREDIQKRLMRQRSQDDSQENLVGTPDKEKGHLLGVDPNDSAIDGLSMVDIETATIVTAERMNIGAVATAAASPAVVVSDLPTVEVAPAQGGEPPKEEQPSKSSGFNALTVDFDGLGFKGLDIAGLGSRSTRGSFDSGTVRMGDVDVDMEMRSALDRLMEDVASTSAIEDDGVEHHSDWRGSTELSSAFKSSPVSRNPSEASMLPPPEKIAKPEPKGNNIKRRQEMILAKRREARGLDESDSEHLKVVSGRPARRRSMSTSDADTLKRNRSSRAELDIPSLIKDTDALHESIDRELNKTKEAPKPTRYQIREREGMIYASSDADRVAHMDRVGDLNKSRAWRPVRRPSDMNEYAKQIREYRAMDKAKAYGKVFVRVLGIKDLDIPIPHQTTYMVVELNNGSHHVTTPPCKLGRDTPIQQEFELIEHSKLEITLFLKVRRDPHIAALIKSQATSPPLPPVPLPIVQQTSSSTTSRSGGMRSFFSSSPKKAKEKIAAIPVPLPPPAPVRQQVHENITRYMHPDGTLARVLVAYKEIAPRCDTKLFETTYKLVGQRLEMGGKTSSIHIGELVLQFFRLPPLPGLPENELPQSLAECHRGLRHVNWHKTTYLEGILTQNGGDCTSWRRRHFRIMGGNLVAFNDVTKRITFTVDLKKVLAVEDDQACGSASTRSSQKVRRTDEYDSLYGVERSFRLTFANDEEIVFFADTDDDKSRWLDVLNALIGHIPPNPLWAELLWQRQEEINKQEKAAKEAAAAAAASSSRPQQARQGQARSHPR